MNGVERVPATQRWAALAVHLFTASGAAVALIALEAAIERDFPRCFAWLGVALFIDGVDGTLARAARVTERASAIDGVVLDLVVDFLTYVVTPVVAIWRSDLMPPTLSFALGLVVAFASALYFADKRMKTGDYWFRGFPALWNIVAIYLFVLRLPVIVSSLLMVLGSAAMFAPIVFVHPLRVEKVSRRDDHGVPGFLRAFRGGDLAAIRRHAVGESGLRRHRHLLLCAAAHQTFALGRKL